MNHRATQIAVIFAIALLAHCAGAWADAPFFQAFQAPPANPTLASSYPGNPLAVGSVAPADSQIVGTPSPPSLAPDAGAANSGAPAANSPFAVTPPQFQTGVIASTETDQPLEWSNGFGLLNGEVLNGASSLMMPWDFGPAACTDCRTDGGYIFHNYSSWRGISEGTGESNNGFSYGFNYATRLGALSEYTGIGAQIGASYGLYDLNGRSSGFHDKEVQQQTFLTVGFFRAANQQSKFSFGVVWDGMFNTNFGQYAVSPFLSQIRGQIAYALNEQHEIGIWTAIRSSNGSAFAGGQSLSYRAVDQLTFFYHHRFGFGGDGVSWFGIPDHSKLGGSGSLGQYTFGGTLTAPLSPRFGAFTGLQYMAPSSRSGAAAAVEESFYITAGIAFYPYANSRPSTVAGECWMPYMPVATDGTFLVDTNHTF